MKTEANSGNSTPTLGGPGIQDGTGKSDKRLRAELNMSSAVRSALTVREFGYGAADALDVGETVDEMGRKVERVQHGDFSEVEAMLTAQAVALDGMFNELARRGAANFGREMSAAETYLRLAFKAQAQCRATLETLAEVKHPRPATFIKQANIAERQQVNNAAVTNVTQVATRTEEKEVNSLKRTIQVRNGT